ncbi:MAG: DUF1349 domain-containing protein [Sphingomonadales bacterium]|nr:MAG: DUF1349 domain-containing protein [Sphingomonadales bacterium]
MKQAFLLLSAVLAACISTTATAQSLGDKPADIAISGIVFTRSLNGAAEASTLDAGGLKLASPAKSDFFRDPDGSNPTDNAPVLLTRIDNRQPFTFTARVTPKLAEVYDAGALYIWARDDLWLKFAFERDERGKSRIVSVRTNATSDDNNHDAVAAGSVHLKISSDTKSIGFYYSVDGKEWQLIRVFKNDYPAEIWTGVSAQSPLGKGNSARFDALSITKASIRDFRKGL